MNATQGRKGRNIEITTWQRDRTEKKEKSGSGMVKSN
jgi:hypothetical protein